jgi:hypothetical protein
VEFFFLGSSNFCTVISHRVRRGWLRVRGDYFQRFEICWGSHSYMQPKDVQLIDLLGKEGKK